MAVSQDDINLARDLYEELRGITKELKSQSTEVTKSRAAFRSFEQAAQAFKLNQEDIKRLNDAELSSLQQKLTTQVAIARQEGDRLATSTDIGRAIEAEVEEFRQLGASEEELLDYRLHRLATSQDLTDEQKALLAAYYSEYEVVEEINKQVEKELQRREQINKSLGFAGALLGAINQTGFGKAFKLDKVQADMEGFADKMATAEGGASRLRTLGVGIKSAFLNLGDVITDPAVVIGALLKSFKEFEKSNREVRQLSGQNATNFSIVNDSLTSTIDSAKTIAALTKEIGINVNAAFGPDTIDAATELTTLTGVSAANASNLALRAEALGDNLDAAADQAIRVTQETALQGKGALNFRQVLDTAASASNSLALTIKGGQEGLIEAAAAAQRLGINLQQAENIADKLLDFESSIAAELEAELLTGQQINLEKARLAALNNDIKTLTEEIGSNEAIMQAFSSGNRIQQEAIAKSLGMSKDEVAKMIFLKQIEGQLTVAQAAAAADISLEEANRLATQEQIKKSIEKITAALAPLLADIASLADNAVSLYITLGLIGSALAVNITAKAINAFTTIRQGLGGVRSAASEVGDVTEDVANSTNQLQAGPRSTIGMKLRDLSRGLRSMAGGRVALGILNMALAGPALLLAVPAIPFLLFMGLTPLTQLGTNLTSLGTGLAALAPGAAGVGVLTLLGIGGAIAVLSIPFLAFMAIPGLGVALSVNLTALGAGLTSLGAAASTGVAFLGPALLAALGVALIPFGFALSLVTPLVQAFGEVIIGVLGAIPPIIEAIASGLSTLLTSLVDNLIKLADPKIAVGLIVLAPGLLALGAATAYLGTISPLILAGSYALAALGVALIPLSMSFQMLAEANMEGLITNLASLAGIAPSLALVGGSLLSIAAGLGAIAIAGIAALPVLAALATLGTLGIIGGGEGADAAPGNDPIAQKLDELNANVVRLIGAVESGGVVEIDGNRAGTAFSLSATNIA
jgi:hypothetical protein